MARLLPSTMPPEQGTIRARIYPPWHSFPILTLQIQSPFCGTIAASPPGNEASVRLRLRRWPPWRLRPCAWLPPCRTPTRTEPPHMHSCYPSPRSCYALSHLERRMLLPKRSRRDGLRSGRLAGFMISGGRRYRRERQWVRRTFDGMTQRKRRPSSYVKGLLDAPRLWRSPTGWSRIRTKPLGPWLPCIPPSALPWLCTPGYSCPGTPARWLRSGPLPPHPRHTWDA